MIEPLNLNDEGAGVARDAVVLTEADDGTSSGGSARGRYDRWFAIVITMVVLLPFVTAIVTRVGRSYLPVQDFAVIDLRVRDVFTRDIPLVGPYSRYGWNHPGPLAFWLVAPFAALFGSPAWATQVGFVMLQATAVVWTAIVSWRRRGLWALALWMAVVCASYVAVGPAAILEPWGPNVALPFFVLFCCLVWLISGDEVTLLPQAAVVGSFLVQTHVGYAPAGRRRGRVRCPRHVASLREALARRHSAPSHPLGRRRRPGAVAAFPLRVSSLPAGQPSAGRGSDGLPRLEPEGRDRERS